MSPSAALSSAQNRQKYSFFVNIKIYVNPNIIT